MNEKIYNSVALYSYMKSSFYDLSETEYLFLEKCDASLRMTTLLSKALLLNASEVNKIGFRLEEKGFVKKKKSHLSRDNYWFEITSSGSDALKKRATT